MSDLQELAPKAADLARRTQSLFDLQDLSGLPPPGEDTGAECRAIIERVQELAQDSADLARPAQALDH